MFSRLLLIFCIIITPIIAIAEPLTMQKGDEMLQELRQIRKLLEELQSRTVPMQYMNAKPLPGIQQGCNTSPTINQPAEQATKLTIKDSPSMGQDDAPLALVIYTDYECPFSRRFETETFPAINKNFILTGKLKFIVMDSPLEIHANAKKAAEATKCAADQNQYWNYRNMLSSANEALDTNRLKSFAREGGLDVVKFEDCLIGNKYSKTISEAAAESRRQGVSGTPTFVIGKVKNGVVEGVRMTGAQPYAAFEQKLNELLHKK